MGINGSLGGNFQQNTYEYCKNLDDKKVKDLSAHDVSKLLKCVKNLLKDMGDLDVDQTYVLKKAISLLKDNPAVKGDEKLQSKIEKRNNTINTLSKSVILKERDVSYTDMITSSLNPSYATRKAGDRGELFMSLQEKMSTMKALGGERRSVTGEHGLKIDGVLFTVDNFAKAIEEKGGKFVTLTIGTEDQQKTLSAIQIDPSKSAKLLDAMGKMEILKAGWERVKVGNIEFIVKQEDVDSVKNSVNLNIKERDFKKGVDRPTMLISPGKDGNYEFYLKQVASLAMEGVNVRLYNYTGQGESEGEEVTDQSRLQDIRAVYEDLKKETREDLIILQGVCVGGGPTSDLAAKITASGRDANIMLVKSPSNYLEVGKMVTKGWLNSIIDSYAENLYIPRYEVSENLKLVKGHKLLIIPKEDDFANKKHKTANISSLMVHHREEDLLKVIEPTGKHNYSWNKDEPTKKSMVDWIGDVCTKRGAKLQPVMEINKLSETSAP